MERKILYQEIKIREVRKEVAKKQIFNAECWQVYQQISRVECAGKAVKNRENEQPSGATDKDW